MEGLFFHVDMDAFYASVEQAEHPELKGKPVVIGSTDARSVVSTCSYEARRYGVHSAMRGSEAKKRCPNAVFIPPNLPHYQAVSSRIFALFRQFSPDVYPVSIDEAFLDMSGTSLLFPSPREAAEQIKQSVAEATGLTLSVGIAPNPFLAKMASDYCKPNGIYEVTPDGVLSFIDRFPLDKLWGVGKRSTERLHQFGFTAPKQIRSSSPETLTPLLGKAFTQFLVAACNGNDPGLLRGEPKSKSLSNEATFPVDVSDPEIIRSKLLSLSHQLFFRLLEEGLSGKCCFIKIRYSDFETHSAQRTLPSVIRTGDELYRLECSLLDEKWNRKNSIRLLGIGISHVQPFSELDQPELFPDRNREKKAAVEKTVLTLLKKGASLKKASSLAHALSSSSPSLSETP